MLQLLCFNLQACYNKERLLESDSAAKKQNHLKNNSYSWINFQVHQSLVRRLQKFPNKVLKISNYKQQKEDALLHLEQGKVNDIVLTVPSEQKISQRLYNQIQILEHQKIPAQLAESEVLGITNEKIAAALYYASERQVQLDFITLVHTMSQVLIKKKIEILKVLADYSIPNAVKLTFGRFVVQSFWITI